MERIGHQAIVLLTLLIAGCATKQVSTSPVLPGWSYECHKMESVDKTDYCIHTKGTPKKTIWYFHGLGCNQDILQGSGCVVGKSASSEKSLMDGLTDTTIITVSFGKAWLLDPFHPKTAHPTDMDATTKNFYEKVMPEIESEHHGRLPRPWKAVGHSMGGANLSTLSLSYPDLFDQIVLAHPMLLDCDPWAPVTGLKCAGGILFVGAEFTQERWKLANPMVRVKTQKSFPKTLVLIADKDDFGLISGPKKFSQQLQSNGIEVESVISNTDHFHYDSKRILEFLN